MHSLEFLFKFKLDSNAPHFYRHNVKRMRSRFAFNSARLGRTPVTMGLIIACLVGFLLCWIPESGAFLIPQLSLQVDNFRLWQPITYPLVNAYFLMVLFEMLWLYWFGTIIENRFGGRPVITTFLAGTLLHAVAFFVAVLATKIPAPALATTDLPITFLVIAVCANQPETEICFWGINVKFKWIAIVKAAIVVFTYGSGFPLYGLILALPLIGAWFYGANKIPGLTFGKSPIVAAKQKKKENREFDEFMGKVRSKEKDRAEQERLRKLFEGSIADDDTPESK